MLRCGNLCRRIGQFRLSFPETLARTMRGTVTLPTFRRIPDRISEVPRVWLGPFLRATPPVALTLPSRPTCLWMEDLAPDQSALLRRLWSFCQHSTYRWRCGRSCLLLDILLHVPHCLHPSRRPPCLHTLPLSFTSPFMSPRLILCPSLFKLSIHVLKNVVRCSQSQLPNEIPCLTRGLRQRHSEDRP